MYGPRCRGVLFVFYLPKGLLVSLERSVSLVCGNAFLTKIPWCITSQSLLKVGSRQTRYREKLCVLGDFVIFGHFCHSIYQLKTYNFHQYYLYMVLMESVSALFMFG